MKNSPNSFAQNTSTTNQITKVAPWLCCVIKNHFVRATDELSRLVIETADQRPATLKDLRTQELALDMQTRLWELTKFQPIGTHQEDISKKFCRLQIREEGTN
jgi:hypothetical protein